MIIVKFIVNLTTTILKSDLVNVTGTFILDYSILYGRIISTDKDTTVKRSSPSGEDEYRIEKVLEDGYIKYKI